jgi:PAS domain S-box-containing protein
MDNLGKGPNNSGLQLTESNHLEFSDTSQMDYMEARISRVLISTNHTSLHEVIQILSEMTSVERGFIFKFSYGFESTPEAYEWFSFDTSPIEVDDDFLDKGGFQFWLDRLNSSGVVDVKSMDELESLPPEEIIRLETLGLSSFLMVPIILMDKSVGGLILLSGNTSPEGWSVEYINAGKSVADMIATVWNHKHVSDELSIYRHNLEETVYTRTIQLEAANSYLQKEISEHKKTGKELQKYRDHLENIVKDRTNALLDSNKKLKEEIEEKNSIEKALREANEKSKLIIDNSQDLIYSMYLDGTIVYMSPQVSKYGYWPEDIIGRNISEFIHEDDLELVINELDNSIKTGRSKAVEFRLIGKYGSFHDVEEMGGPLFVGNNVEQCVGIVRDITERNLTKKAIQENEERFRQLSNATFEAIEIHDGTEILEVNQACIDLFGFTREEIIGLDPLALAVPEHRDMIRDKIHSRITEPYEAVGLRKDGSTFFGEVRGKQIEFRGKTVRVTAIRDITERKVSDLALRESEKRYRILAENVKDIIWMTDLQLKYTYISPSVERVRGFTVEEMLNSTVHSQITPASVETALEVLNKEKLIEQKPDCDKNRVRKLDLEVYCKDGSTLWTEHTISFLRDNDGKPVGLLGVARDIDDRKKAEAELRKSRRQYQELFNNIMEGISIFDENENIKFCNPAFASIFDMKSANELIGRSLWDFVDADQKDLIVTETKKRQNGISSKYEVEIISALGSKKRIQCYISPRFDENGNYRGTFGSTIDVTETRRLQEFSSRAQRLEIAGRIASQVAHDFNNLLGPMTAYPELIRDDLPKDHPAHKYLDDIFASATRMADINQQLLTLGRRGHYNLEVMNLNEVVNLVLDQVFIFEEKIVINKMLDNNLQNINGGKSQIYRAISNIVLNAQDAIPDGGEINIKTENVKLAGYLGKFTKIPEGEYVKLSLADTGSGIPTEILPRIFEPFFTSKTSDKKRGSGLGLSVVHAVMEDHNAFVDWDSQPDQGTSFYLYFPVSQRKSDAVFESHIVGGDESILVIDDDTLQRGVIRSLLEKLGYDVETAGSGEAGIEYLKKNTRDLVLLDMIMPGGMDGAETYKNILNITPDQKAIVVSGYAETGKVEEILKLGVNTFLRKPITLRALAHALRNEFDNNSG